ncbi:hypothetical protein MYAM1_000317 [Malassezia yamatoensis]|uniref:Protoporphyrinogen oxidase n=1 Tax=Malassezia yamatoensis TaxID=253288 RepID=A0AAJ6CET6_9BASI|nr:hypothetical protein MYAM1_000317 [Malassezia yamatoensis]
MAGRAGQKTIAILGGGVSGLASAYTLSRSLPNHRIVVLEAKDRLGGWVNSERVRVHEPHVASEATALLESGPRSLMPSKYKGLRTLELLSQLNITKRMVLVPRTSKSAKNRFLFHGGRLNKLPSSFFGALNAALRLPLLREALPGILKEPWVPAHQTAGSDESVHAFISRRFGTALAENMISAMMHGIYAGDSRELSAKSIIPSLVDLEAAHGSVLRAMLPKKFNRRHEALENERVARENTKHAEVSQRLDPSLVEAMRDTSIYSFPNGLGEIVSSLTNLLIASQNVEIRMSSTCQKITPTSAGYELTMSGENTELSANRLVAALPDSQLGKLLPDLPNLGYNPSATLSVVDIVLAPADGSSMRYKLPIEGFGFLVPRSAANNLDEILGVVLDSDAVPNQGTVDAEGNPSFIKLTVMIGGPYWRGKKAAELPHKGECEQRAVRALEQMLGIPSSILHTHIRFLRGDVLKDTIPQYLVGHPFRMRELYHTLLNNARWRDRLTLLGISYAGVGINDCVSTAMDASDAIIEQELGTHSGKLSSEATGLPLAL